MNEKQNKITNLVLWLTPTGVELAVYIFITFFTAILCSQDFVNSLFFVSGDFNPIRSGIGSINGLLEGIVGERVAGSLSLGIFWGTVGLVVNLLWWLGANFSTELNNDLVYSKYVHPKDINPRSQLRDFIIRTAIRTGVAVIAIVYTNFVLSQWLPRISSEYASVFEDWDYTSRWSVLIPVILSQILLLHIFVVLTRIILLRKQIFND